MASVRTVTRSSRRRGFADQQHRGLEVAILRLMHELASENAVSHSVCKLAASMVQSMNDGLRRRSIYPIVHQSNLTNHACIP